MRTLDAGETFQFGLTLIGDGIVAFPYVLQGLRAMGEAGFGLRQRAPGEFEVQRVVACNPYIAAEQVAYEAGRQTVYAPGLPVKQEQISAYGSMLSSSELRLELKSPLRLVANGSLVRNVSMEIVMRRLLRRLTDLHAGFGSAPLEADFEALLRVAQRCAPFPMKRNGWTWKAGAAGAPDGRRLAGWLEVSALAAIRHRSTPTWAGCR